MTGFSSLSQMMLALRGRWKVAVAAGAAVAVLIITVCAMMPPVYTATAWVVFNTKGSDPVADKNDTLAFGQYVSGEVDLIGNRRIIQQVAYDPALLHDPRTLRQQDRHERDMFGRRLKAPLRDWLVDFITKNATITNAKGTRTASIAAAFDDPVWAAKVAGLIAKSYLDTAVDLTVAPARQNVAFFKVQKAARESDLIAAQGILNAFLKETGMTGLEAKSDTDDLQFRTLAERLSATQADQAGSSAQAGIGGADAAVSAGKISNPVVQQLRTEIATQTAALRDMTVLSGPNYPTVVQARARLAELETQLSAELAKVQSGVERTNRAVSREGAAISALAEQKRRYMTATAANRSKLQILQGDVDRAKANYDAVAAQLADVELKSVLQAPNAAILSPAPVPRGPSFPYWPLIIAFALAAGAVFGIIAALVKELLVPRVRSTIDLQALLGGAPVLCDLGA